MVDSDKPRMHIALVTETYPPEVNGVAMTLGWLVKGMASRGHRVDVIRPRQNKSDLSRAQGNIHHQPMPGLPIPRYDGLRFGLPARRKLLRRWTAETPDVVHVATEGPLGYTALRAAQRLGVPVTSSFHTNFHQYGKHYGFGFLHRMVMGYLRYVHNQTAVTMVPSHDVMQLLEGDGFHRVEILARGVDTELFGPHRRSEALRQSWGVGPDDMVCAYVGRVAEEKNIPLACEAFERIRQERPNTRFVLVGDGPARSKLEKQHRDYIFAGMRRGEDLATHYASADIFLFPSVTETFGNVITEAMASGLCVLVYDYAAAKMHVKSGENGIAVHLDDRDAYLKAAAGLGSDCARIRRIGEAARHSVEELSWDRIVGMFEQRLNDAMPAASGYDAACVSA